MSNNLELVNAIECYVNKYWQIPEKVEWPKWEFKMVGICQVTIHENSLKDVGNLWTFKGSALISTTDCSQVTVSKKFTIIGNAAIKFDLNRENSEEHLSIVNHVIITKIGN